MYEVSVGKGEIIEVTDQEAPAGWTTVKKENGDEGLVPEIFLGPAPRTNPEGPTQEELEIRKAKEQKAELEEQLKRTQEALKQMERSKMEALEEAEEREEKLRQQMKEMEERDIERQKAEDERVAERNAEKGAETERLKRMEDEEAIWPSKDQRALKAALKEAEVTRNDAEKTYRDIEEQRLASKKALDEAERKAFDAARKVRAEEQARDANERAMQLLPGLKELLEPTQKELQKAVQTVTSAVMKNAEESARLLAKLATKEDPDAEFELARQRRIDQQALQSGERSLGSGRLQLTDLIVPDEDDSAKTKARRRAAWRTISDVAPETKVHASKIEATHKALRRELKAARRAIVESRYGEVEMPDMTPQQRIQNRNVHAAYSFVMRQQKGREKELERAQQFTTR